MPNPGIHVLLWIERIGNVERTGGRGHQLHQSHGTFAGDSIGIEVGFHLDDRPDQVRIDVVTGGRLHDGGVNFLLGEDPAAVQMEQRAAVEISVDFGGRRTGGTDCGAAGRNRLKAMLARAPVNQARSAREAASGRSSMGSREPRRWCRSCGRTRRWWQ